MKYGGVFERGIMLTKLGNFHNLKMILVHKSADEIEKKMEEF